MAIPQQEAYFRGETIGFYIAGDETTDLDGNDFKLSIIDPLGVAIEIAKSDCTQTDPQTYYYEIANTKTKTMKIGKYKLEIYLGETYVLIFEDENFFNLKDSYSKKYAV